MNDAVRQRSGRGENADELFRRYAASRSRKDRNRLVELHLGFAHHLAQRYSHRGVAADDLHQIALLGLVKAVERFDPDLGYAFTTFAGRTIEGELKRHFRDTTWSVRVPRSMQELHLSVRRANDELTQSLGRSPSVPEVAQHIGASADEVVEALAAASAYQHDSLDAPRGGDDHASTPLGSLIAGDDRSVEQTEDRIVVERLIATLPEREQEIVRLRFYEQLSQSDIAARVGISQMHVSRLLRRSFALMREASAG